MASQNKWNWQQNDWPDFSYDPAAMEPLESTFTYHSGVLLGASMHVHAGEQEALLIELLSEEAINTSQIEGEVLNRDSVQSSIRRQFGLLTPRQSVGAAEAGIAEMMVDLYRHYARPLTHEMLWEWHAMLMNGRRDLEGIGGYRTHQDPMQVVSGRLDVPTVHFEAPPSSRVVKEMDQFIEWFNGSIALPALTRASIAHLYFESIHPFEDGNGRIGRCLVEKSLAQSLKHPVTIGLSYVIQQARKRYYAMLEQSNKSNQIDGWLEYFSQTILEAQSTSIKRVEFIIQKTHFYDRFRGQLNARQEKAIGRIFAEGMQGFKGGVSAENYLAITGTSRATATRDLSDLVDKGALKKSGQGKGTRYALELK